MAGKTDKSLLWLAILIFLFAVIVSFIPLGEARDPMSRPNLMFFCFVALSVVLALCKDIDQKFWTWTSLAAGAAMWFISTWWGTPGGWKSLIDTFSFW